MTLNTFQQWQVDNGHHVTEQVDGDEFHAPELCPPCFEQAMREHLGTTWTHYADRQWEEGIPLLHIYDVTGYEVGNIPLDYPGPVSADVALADWSKINDRNVERVTQAVTEYGPDRAHYGITVREV